MAQPAPVGGLEEDLIEKPTVQLIVVPPKLRGPCWAVGRAGRVLLSGAAGDSRRDDEKHALEIGLQEGPSLRRGEWGRSGVPLGPRAV